MGGCSVVLSMFFVVGFGLNLSFVVSLYFGFEVKMESKSSSSLLFESWVSTHWSSQYLHLPRTFFLSDSADLCKMEEYQKFELRKQRNGSVCLRNVHC